jgi:F0F1-type ATP synthase alpha subunit
VERCREFETALYRYIDNAHAALWAQIREKKVLDDALRAALHTAIKEAKERFLSADA